MLIKSDSRHDLKSIFLKSGKKDEDRLINEKWEKENKTLVSTFSLLSDSAIQELIF